MKYIMYHGRTSKSTAFDPKFVGQGHDNEGPGFYFSSDYSDAASYAHPGGIVIKAEIRPTKLLGNGKPGLKDIKQMALQAPDLLDTLSNWDEQPDVAMNKALKHILSEPEQKAFQSIWYNFYRYEPSKYVNNMVKLGYSGFLVQKTGLQHMIVYDPGIIKILETKPHGSK